MAIYVVVFTCCFRW